MTATTQTLPRPRGGGGRSSYAWQAPLGATPHGGGTVFRVWAPEASGVSVRMGRSETPLEHAGMGVWEGELEAGEGDDYWYVLTPRSGGRARRLPDPCSRHQPAGIRGPSRVFDPAAHRWEDAAFRPAPLARSVLYELHVGTFTEQGTFDSARAELPRLRELGITAIELMPVAEGPGERGWGYDGVYISAAHHAHGGPRALQRLVEDAHAHGIAVILDVVYNHLGASGARAIRAFGAYFTDRYRTFWGDAINFDDAFCDPVREWVLQSAEGWVRDFHIDGLRLDAIHAIFDQSPTSIVAEIASRVHSVNPRALMIAESALNDPRVIRPASEGGYGCDAQWADDFHHALRTLLTGDTDGYYADFGCVADLAKAYRRPFVHDGGYSPFRHRRFGAPADDRPAEQFIVFSQNHDQVGNRALGDRLPQSVRALAALCVLLSPFTPMLFMGEEYGELAPFQFFTDHIDDRIARATREGRRREFARFAAFGEHVPDPQDPATFRASKLTGHGEAGLEELYRDMIRARAELAGEADAVLFDEAGRWLRVSRSSHELVLNFASRPLRMEIERDAVVLSTGDAQLEGSLLSLPAMSGALLASGR